MIKKLHGEGQTPVLPRLLESFFLASPATTSAPGVAAFGLVGAAPVVIPVVVARAAITACLMAVAITAFVAILVTKAAAAIAWVAAACHLFFTSLVLPGLLVRNGHGR